MQQPNQPTSEYGNLASIQRHLERLDERLDERTRNLATRQDLESLRKDMVTRDLMESQLASLRDQYKRFEQDRAEHRKDIDKRFDDVDERFKTAEEARTTKAERFWQRVSPIIAAIALLIALLQFLSHVRLTP